MTRVVVKLSRTALLGVGTALLGMALALYARKSGADWARLAGLVLLFGGALVYFIARFAGSRPPRDGPPAPPPAPH